VAARLEGCGPSVTARQVAAHRLGFTRLPAPHGDPAADDALAADVAVGREVPLNRMHDYLAARTAFFDRIVVAAIDRGVRQIVVGAAGLDPDAPSLFLLEEIAVYLEPAVLETVLDQFRQIAAAGWQPSGDQRVPVRGSRRGLQGPLPGLRGGDGGAGQVRRSPPTRPKPC
jgi:O-methyltransferase involved in polyketide biosynthesis